MFEFGFFLFVWASFLSMCLGLAFSQMCYGWTKFFVVLLSFVPFANILMVSYIIVLDEMQRKKRVK